MLIPHIKKSVEHKLLAEFLIGLYCLAVLGGLAVAVRVFALDLMGAH